MEEAPADVDSCHGMTVPVPQASLQGATEDERVLEEAFVQYVEEAAQLESRAMELDREGHSELAIECYRQAAELLMQGASACPEGRSDRVTLAKHTGEIMGRVVYLQSLSGAPATAPVEEHIGSAQVTCEEQPRHMRSAFSAAAPDDEYVCMDSTGYTGSAAKEKQPGRVKQALSAAAVGGAAGLLVIHGPLSAVALAAGAAYATTRNDAAGEAAREMGTAGIRVVSRAKTFDREHRVSEKVASKMNAALAKAKTIDEKYGVTDKTQAVASSSWETLSEFERKHKVGKNLGKGVSIATGGAMSAASKVAGWFSKPSKQQASIPLG